MKAYTKRPVTIHAVQFEDTTESIADIAALTETDISVDYGNPLVPAILIDTLEGQMKACVGDYIIRGIAGEVYPCKPEIFELSYDIGTPNGELSFGAALDALKAGQRVARSGWNGKNMFLFLLGAADGLPTKIIHDPALRQVIEDELGGDTFDALASIRMFTADKKILTGWLASQSDMMAMDWTIL